MNMKIVLTQSNGHSPHLSTSRWHIKDSGHLKARSIFQSFPPSRAVSYVPYRPVSTALIRLY